MKILKEKSVTRSRREAMKERVSEVCEGWKRCGNVSEKHDGRLRRRGKAYGERRGKV